MTPSNLLHPFLILSVVPCLLQCSTGPGPAFYAMSASAHEQAAAHAEAAAGSSAGEDGARSRQLALEHRTEATRLHREAEQACAGIPEPEQRTCPIARGGVVAVKPIHDRPFQKGRDFLAGATVYVPATPGMTAQWLGRLIACHDAREAELGRTATAACPVTIPPARVSVSNTDTGFAVAIKSDELKTAREILEVSQSFVAR